MVNNCPSCGGPLKYDIASGKLVCTYCNSSNDPEQYRVQTAADENPENPEYNVSIFTCPNCGAEITTSDNAAVDYCMYCGSFVTLESRLETIRRPDTIVPFKKTREQCKEEYAKMMRNKIYAPKEFRDPEFLNGFRGIYIPYWKYDYSYGPEVLIHGEKESRRGDYIVTQEYTTHATVREGSLKNVVYDASSTFDDTIGTTIAPFDYREAKPFNPAYMFGFYADTADLDAEAYQAEADSTARDEIWSSVTANPQVKNGNPTKPKTAERLDRDLRIKKQEPTLSMLPVWFLTWRKKDRVAYTIMNGESGETFAEIPVDIKRYLLISLITAIPIFILYTLFFTFNGTEMLNMTIVLAVATTMIYMYELDKIVRRFTHADDKGYLLKHQKGEEDEPSSNAMLDLLAFGWDLLKTGGIVAVVIAIMIITTLADYISIIAVIVIIAVPGYTLFRIRSNAKIMKDKTVAVDVLGSILGAVLCVVIRFIDPASDYPYYITAIAGMLGVAITAIRTMYRYNDLATRPIPQFTDHREGGEA